MVEDVGRGSGKCQLWNADIQVVLVLQTQICMPVGSGVDRWNGVWSFRNWKMTLLCAIIMNCVMCRAC